MNKGFIYLSSALLSLVILLAILLIPKISEPESDSQKRLEKRLEKEQETVYSVVLAREAVFGMGGKAILLKSTTFPWSGSTTENQEGNWLEISDNLPDLSRVTYDNYLARNDQPYPLSPDMDLSIKYYLISEAELGEIYQTSGESPDGMTGGPYNEMISRYPGTNGLTRVSQVGFNPEMTEALVYVANESGSLSAEYYLVRLVKQSGGWSIVDTWLIWIA